MKKILNVLMVMCLAVAAFTLTFAIALPASKTAGANVSATSATPSVSPSVEFDAVRPAFVGVNYILSAGDFSHGLALDRQRLTVSELAEKTRNRSVPNYGFPPNQSLFDTPLFANSKSLKQPPIFSQTPTRNSQLRR